MIVDHTEERPGILVLQFGPVLDCAEVVSDVQFPGGLYTAEYSCHASIKLSARHNQLLQGTIAKEAALGRVAQSSRINKRTTHVYYSFTTPRTCSIAGCVRRTTEAESRISVGVGSWELGVGSWEVRAVTKPQRGNTTT